MNRRRQVTASFDAVAERYEQYAAVQRHAALRLADALNQLDLPRQPNVLELGCGTGLLSNLLLRHRPEGHFLLTDASLPMLLTARRLPGPIRCAVMDAQAPAVNDTYDLIASNLTWQWLDAPLHSFSRWMKWLKPGGWLAMTTLGEKTFAEWTAACHREHIPSGILTCPTRQEWESLPVRVTEELLPVTHPSALTFLQELRALGADLPAPGYRPLPGGTLRRLLRRHQEGFTVSYHLYYIFWQNSPG
ncbi:MAG: methyltransferase domain-containing protein [Magnetococcales bacterium]|nr:methyltransferase domain-containing protein [Magnetococcales bacterium]